MRGLRRFFRGVSQQQRKKLDNKQFKKIICKEFLKKNSPYN